MSDPTKPLPDELEAELAHLPGHLAKALRSFRQTLAEKAPSSASPPEARPEPAPQEAQLILFPKWADDRRAAMHATFRSALFPVLNNQQPRRFLQAVTLASVEGIEVVFTGQQFDQSDLDVYLELLNIAHETPFGIECSFTAYGLLKALGRATGAEQYRQLHTQLIRLCAGTVDMTDHKVRYFGHLVEGGVKDEITTAYTISINPKWAQYFKAGLWSSLDVGQRRSLGRSQTAKALHAYYSTHANPGPHRYETLAAIIGLKNSNTRQRKVGLVKAHEELKQVGFLADFEAGADTITPKVNHTPSQAQYIAGKNAKSGTRRPRKKLS